MHDEWSDVFTGLEYFKGTFVLQVKDDTKPYQAQLRRVVYMLKEPVKKEPKNYKNIKYWHD